LFSQIGSDSKKLKTGWCREHQVNFGVVSGVAARAARILGRPGKLPRQSVFFMRFFDLRPLFDQSFLGFLNLFPFPDYTLECRTSYYADNTDSM
jgi:hypothetical protein